ncbi:methionine aminopeptidase 1D, mitochondrial-like isoform X2 [Rhopilema esculentum]|uniref:methionine aminopeptidase 1D, mitochondrial-like isoform X2 n=1 Tax=Rhopilema esculentum TaxID=499914 RepID=UPI0031D30C68
MNRIRTSVKIGLNSFQVLKRGFKKCLPRYGYSVIMKPGYIHPGHAVPISLDKPPYAETGVVPPSFERIKPKTEEEIQLMRDSCEVTRKLLWTLKHRIKPGITTEKLDFLLHWLCLKFDVYPSPRNYKGFPKDLCTSVNNVACHGIPDDRPLEDGDIISIDVSSFKGGFHGDTCDTVMVGNVDNEGQRLVEVTKKCLESAIEVCGPGVKFNKIGRTISKVVKGTGFSVCDVFTGHGIGREFHCPPQIIHTANPYPGKMWPGMTFTIEPIICEGSPNIEIWDDGWTAVTVDNKRAAQFEHTILITDYGAEVLTIDKAHPLDMPTKTRLQRHAYKDTPT